MIGIIVTDMIRVLAPARHDHICCLLLAYILAYIETFALTSATTDFSQSSHTITKGCMRIGLSCLSVMTRILFAIFRVSAYRVRMAFRNLLLRISVTCYYVISTLMFRPIFFILLKLDEHVTDPADTIHTTTDGWG